MYIQFSLGDKGSPSAAHCRLHVGSMSAPCRLHVGSVFRFQKLSYKMKLTNTSGKKSGANHTSYNLVRPLRV